MPKLSNSFGKVEMYVSENKMTEDIELIDEKIKDMKKRKELYEIEKDTYMVESDEEYLVDEITPQVFDDEDE